MRILILLFFCNYLIAQDFRSAYWGQSMEDVDASESVVLAERNENQLIYLSNIIGIDAAIVYMFNKDGKLDNAMYMFTQDHSNDNLYIEDFNRVFDGVKEKYSNVEIETKWSYNIFKDDPSLYGASVALGYHNYRYEYKGIRTIITGILTGDNGVIRHFLWYKDASVNDLLESQF